MSILIGVSFLLQNLLNVIMLYGNLSYLLHTYTTWKDTTKYFACTTFQYSASEVPNIRVAA